MNRYNIALLATRPVAYIQAAQTHFASYATGYLLGPNSLPHITICQFYAEETSLPLLKEELKKTDKNPPIHLTGLEFSKNKKEADVWGASLVVVRTPELMLLHHFVVRILQEHGLTPLNNVGDLYRPHLTLARIKGLNVQDFSSEILEDTAFELILGKSDELGQLVQVHSKEGE